MTAGPIVQPYPIYESTPTLEQIHRRLNAENIDLRGRLDMARKATSAAQELLEAERQKNAALNDKLINAEDARIKELRKLLDTTLLLRTNDAATIADLQRQLREAEAQLKAQRLSAVEVAEIRAYAPWTTKKERARADAAAAENAENLELRRTISLMAKTAAEVQDNFRLIAELAADPADEKRKENTK